MGRRFGGAKLGTIILVDSSVWIDYFRDARTPQVELLDSLFGRTPLAVGDLIATEVLQGIRSQRAFNQVRKVFDSFEHVDLAGYELAVKAAENVHILRQKGVTVRKNIDTLIATRCIENGLILLHADKDFLPFSEHLGLRLAHA